MPRYNKGRFHDPVPGVDYLAEDSLFRAGKDLSRLVKWNDTCGWVHGIVEAQKPGWLRIYVFNKDTYGKRRTVKRRMDVLFI